MAFHGDAQSRGRAVHVANCKAKAIPRFWAKVDRSDLFGCWLWTGAKHLQHGYGRVRWRGRAVNAHRVALGLIDGDWDNPLDVCHTCDVRLCVNPAHLWRGSRLENMRDAKAKGRLTWPVLNGATHCIHGHEWTPENTGKHWNNRFQRFARRCLTCSKIQNNQRNKAYRQRQRAQET